MWCGVLGTLDVRATDGTPVTVSGPARRLLLAALASRVGRPVRAETLVEHLWGSAPPPRTAAKTLQSHVARLRDDLGRAGNPVRTVPGGYCLDLEPEDVDATDFEGRVVAALVDERPEKAIRELDEALALWRGDPYEEFGDAAFTVPERVRLVELRHLAGEHRTDLALDLGHDAELVTGLEARVAAAPYRERGWQQLILALYRAGRQTEALAAYRRAGATLVEGVGVDPGPELRELEARILRQDPALTPAARRPSRITVVDEPPDRCPYVGLAAYQDGDSALFVGRERLVAELAGRLAEHPVVVVAGASGTGKSSLLRAGLLPALRSGALPGSAAWRVAVTGVTDLDATTQGSVELLVVDQAEELFTRLDPAGRRAAADVLQGIVEAGGRVVLAVRGDYYARLAEVEPFGAHAQAATLLAGPLRADELRRVIVEPAERVGLDCEPALVETVLDEVVGQAHALPLVSAALVRTWENRSGSVLTLEGYRRGGGVASALEDTAEEAYATLDADGHTAARRLFVRLAVLDGEHWVRRPLRRSDAAADPDVLAVLTAARLVTVSDASVELTHEALLESWPRLQAWLEERALAAALLDHLDTAAPAWAAAGRPESDLYRGPRLQAVLDWHEEHPGELDPVAGEFLGASAAAAGAELDRERRRADRETRRGRRLRTAVVALAVVVVLAAVAAVLAVRSRSRADAAAREARAAALTADVHRLAAESLIAPDTATAGLLAVAAYRLQDSADSRGALLAAVERGQSALWRLSEPHRLLRIAATPDGSRLVMMDNRQSVYVVDPRTRRVVARYPSGADAVDGLTPDGRSVITLGPNGQVAVLDAGTGRRTHLLVTTADDSTATEPVLSTDGRWLVVLTTVAVPGGKAIDVFDARNWSAPPRHFTVAGSVAALAPGDHTVAVQTVDGAVEVRDTATLRVLSRRAAPANPDQAQLGLSRDGTVVAVSDADPRAVTLLGRGAPVPLPTQPEGVSSVTFAPGGGEVALTSYSGSVAVYRVGDGAQVEDLAGQAGPVIAAAWTGTTRPTGLYTVGLDSTLVSWSVDPGPRLVTESGADVSGVDRGERFGDSILGLTPVQGNGPASQLRLYRADLRTGRQASWPLHLRDGEYVNQAVADTAADRALVSIQDDPGHNRIEIWDLTRGVRTGTLALPASTPRLFPFGLTAALSPDGRTAYASLGATRIGVFDVPSGRYRRGFDVRFGAGVDDDPWLFAPDGRLIVAGIDTGPAPDQRLALVDPRTGHVDASGRLGDIRGPRNLAWSPDGALLAVGTYDGSISLLDARTLRARATVLSAEPGYVSTVSFAPDGRTVVSAGTAGTVNLWSVPDLRREADGIAIGNGANNSGMFAWFAPSGTVAGFAPDPERPATTDLRWFTLPVQPDRLARTACALAGGDITRAQWQRYVGDRPYRKVC